MCRHTMAAVTVAVAVGGLVPVQASAQDWRNVTSFRQRSTESDLDVVVRYGAGEMAIRPGSPGELYRVGIRYDSEAFDPVTDYTEGRLEVGVKGTGRGVRLSNNEGGEMTLTLSPDVPLDLDMDFGAVEAVLELGGLHLTRVDIETGASDTEILVTRPNPGSCDALNITMGAAALEAHGLGNANCGRITVEGGVGDMSLDFSGEWRKDMEADITMALGSVTFWVPQNVGVRVDKQTFLAGFEGRRFIRRDGVYYSDNWDSAERRLTIDLEGAFGTFDVRWVGAAAVTP